MVRVKSIKAPQQPTDSSSAALKLAPLQTSDQTRLALLIAFGPYCKERLQQLYTRWNTQQQQYTPQPPPQPTLLQERCRSYFVRLYPLVQAALQGADLYCTYQYLLGVSPYSDLRNILLRQVVRRVTQQDAAAATTTSQPQSSSSTTSAAAAAAPAPEPSASSSSSTTDRLQSSMLYLVATAVTVSWFTQLRAWYQERYQQQQQQLLLQSQQSGATSRTTPRDNTIIIPPPPRLSIGDSKVAMPKGCPLCGRLDRIHPTACAGYVFCLSCIVPFVREHCQCPVTGSNVTESKLVRLYEPADNIL
jgi:Pex2 / Pex12 amino terminal region